MHKTSHRSPALNYYSRPPNRWRSLSGAKIMLLVLAGLALVATGMQIEGRSFSLATQISVTGATHGEVVSHQEGKTLELKEYWQLVEATRDQAAWARNQPENEIRQTFSQATKLWESLEAVRLSDGTNTPIDTSVIVTELRADPPNPERLETLLNTMLEQRQSWPAGPFGTADIQSLKEILAKPEYQWSEEAPPSPLEEWIARQFERFVNWLFGALEGSISSTGLRIWQLILIGLGALALVFVLGYMGRHLRKVIAAEAELGSDDHIEENLSASAALSKAQAMSDSGDYRMAVRYLYLAALLQLEERGLLRYDRSRTNREYLGDIKRRRILGLSDSFTEVVEVFDRVWYGYQPLDQAGYENYSEAVAQVGRLRE